LAFGQVTLGLIAGLAIQGSGVLKALVAIRVVNIGVFLAMAARQQHHEVGHQVGE